MKYYDFTGCEEDVHVDVYGKCGTIEIGVKVGSEWLFSNRKCLANSAKRCTPHVGKICNGYGTWMTELFWSLKPTSYHYHAIEITLNFQYAGFIVECKFYAHPG